VSYLSIGDKAIYITPTVVNALLNCSALYLPTNKDRQEEGIMPFCSNCGTELSEEELIDKLCFSCGVMLLKEQSLLIKKPKHKPRGRKVKGGRPRLPILEELQEKEKLQWKSDLRKKRLSWRT